MIKIIVRICALFRIFFILFVFPHSQSQSDPSVMKIHLKTLFSESASFILKIFIYWLGGLIVNQFQQKSYCLKQVSKFLHTDNLCFHCVPLFILFNFLHGGRGVCSTPVGVWSLNLNENPVVKHIFQINSNQVITFVYMLRFYTSSLKFKHGSCAGGGASLGGWVGEGASLGGWVGVHNQWMGV